jgi:hypothetical protein
VAKRRFTEEKIFFPWESHGGVRRWLGFGRLRPIAVLVGLIAGIIGIAGREARRSGTRQTRAVLYETERAAAAYIADHDGGCPNGLQDVASYMRRQTTKRDAWGQLPRLTCPANQSGEAFRVISDGPDRIPGGLDRID